MKICELLSRYVLQFSFLIDCVCEIFVSIIVVRVFLLLEIVCFNSKCRKQKTLFRWNTFYFLQLHSVYKQPYSCMLYVYLTLIFLKINNAHRLSLSSSPANYAAFYAFVYRHQYSSFLIVTQMFVNELLLWWYSTTQNTNA